MKRGASSPKHLSERLHRAKPVNEMKRSEIEFAQRAKEQPEDK